MEELPDFHPRVLASSRPSQPQTANVPLTKPTLLQEFRFIMEMTLECKSPDCQASGAVFSALQAGGSIDAIKKKTWVFWSEDICAFIICVSFKLVSSDVLSVAFLLVTIALPKSGPCTNRFSGGGTHAQKIYFVCFHASVFLLSILGNCLLFCSRSYIK